MQTPPVQQIGQLHQGRSALTRSCRLRGSELMYADVKKNTHSTQGWVGRSLERHEDAALLMGQGRYVDDFPIAPNTLHAAVVRASHAHALITEIDTTRALAVPGVRHVITGEQIRAISDPFLTVLKQPIDQWALAVERVRYVGEAVAVVLADDRYIAEDGAALVDILYEPLPVVVDPVAAVRSDAPLLHPAAGSNQLSVREFVYGEPDAAFARAERTISVDIEYPRSSYTPMECFAVVAEYRPGDKSFDVLANFQGPFSAHPVMAKALRVPGSRLRLRIPPDSGGSFGIKLSVFPYIVLMGLAARISGRPVKWIEDRLEHLQAANSGPNRITRLDAAVEPDGRVTALRFDNLEDYGAYLRAPMPGPLYRMHGATTGAYDIRHLAMVNRVVVTNKMPAALVRGFGGPQLYLALERLMQRIAVELGLDPLEVIRRNLISADAFPYRTPAGALYDSGDYQKAIEIATGDGRLTDLLRRRDEARAAGKLYGIGYAAVVEPGMSNMGYLSTILPEKIRQQQGPKNGAVSMVRVNVDAVGGVSMTADVTVQGQGHATALSQIVADQLGLHPRDISVNLEIDTQKDAWSIAAGSYSCRFSPGTAVAAHLAGKQVRDKVARIAAGLFETTEDDVGFGGGRVFSIAQPAKSMPFGRAAGTAHWSPVLVPDTDQPGISETGIWAPQELAPPTGGDEINTSLTYGFVFDMCGIEIDPLTMQVKVDRYVSMHDAGKLINPLLAEGQIRGAFVQGLATALYEEIVYDDKTGALQTGTFAEYLVPTACEVPQIEIIHMETPSPFTPLGAKGLAEGNCMSTPVCIANAVADALSLRDVRLPITPNRLNAVLATNEGPAPTLTSNVVDAAAMEQEFAEATIAGSGTLTVATEAGHIWDTLLDPQTLKNIIPGCHTVTALRPDHFQAEVSLGVGPVRGRFIADVYLSDLVPQRQAKLSGELRGPLGKAEGKGRIILSLTPDGTRIDYAYGVDVGGKVASVGGRMIRRAADMIIGQFFERLVALSGDGDATPTKKTRSGLMAWLVGLFGGQK
ncbi:xanthine dehydrogenase family protein molybdopterin-binding subunit [Agrobacterium tumefaciens]